MKRCLTFRPGWPRMGDPALNVPDGQTDAILALVNVWPISLTDCSHSPISSNMGINAENRWACVATAEMNLAPVPGPSASSSISSSNTTALQGQCCRSLISHDLSFAYPLSFHMPYNVFKPEDPKNSLQIQPLLSLLPHKSLSQWSKTKKKSMV